MSDDPTGTAAAASCEACGWAAAFCSMLAFGSFGVPIKSQAAVAVDIDPLVFQSYKTFMCFSTSWLVLWALGEEFDFTPWGIVSGLFWVPGGVATIYAVKNAGLAIGIGIGSSFIVLVSFYWGIFVFDERVHSRMGASFAILSMILGLIGMSYFSSPESAAAMSVPVEESEVESVVLHLNNSSDDCDQQETDAARHRQLHRRGDYRGLGSHDEADDINERSELSLTVLHKVVESNGNGSFERTQTDAPGDDNSSESLPEVIEEAPTFVGDSVILDVPQQHVTVYGIKVSRRHLGMLSAAFCGLWGGSIMAPMKWCKSDTKGTHYLISFAIGSAIVNTSLWLFRYLYYAAQYRSLSVAYERLPSFHIRRMWRAGGLSGLLWSIGNFFSLISVFYLGEGVGYPLVQTSILVSGLWGIFYFQEVTGRERISKWFLSSLLTIFGILLLSYEHHEK